MITGLNMHCVNHPVMTVKSRDGRHWLELSNGGSDAYTSESHVAIHSRDGTYEALKQAADGFNAAFAPVVAVIEDREPVAFREAAE